MNKDLKGIILFAGLFLFICYLFLFFLLLINTLRWTPVCGFNDDKDICISLVILASLVTKFFQIIGLICMSFYGIHKTDNLFIKKIFNSWSFPTIIFLISILLDYCFTFLLHLINTDFTSKFNETYNNYFALSRNFVVIYIFSIGYQFIKLIKEKIQQLRRWSTRQRNSWQLF